MITKKKRNTPTQRDSTLHLHWRAGLLALLIGGFVTGIGGFISVRESAKDIQITPWELTPFILFGIVIMACGRGISARRDIGRIRSWYGIILPGLPPLALYWKSYDIANAAGIACYGVETGPSTGRGGHDWGGGGSYDCYIDLETADGELKTLVGITDPADARRAAKRLALFFQLPLTVQVHRGELHLGPGSMTRIQPEELALNWFDRMRLQFPAGIPETPSPVERLSLAAGTENKRLLLPRGRLRRGCHLSAAIGLASTAGAAGALLQGVATPWFGFGLFLGLSATALLISSLLMFLLWFIRLDLEFATGSVTFRWHYPGWGIRDKVITANAVEALEELPQSEGSLLASHGPEGVVIRLLTEEKCLHFGWGLSDRERGAVISWIAAHLMTQQEKDTGEMNSLI